MLAPSWVAKENWPPNYTEVFRWRQEQLLRMRENPELIYGAKLYYSKHSVEFITHWVDTYDPRNAMKREVPAYMPFILFERQKEMVEFLTQLLEREADGMIEKCRDAGATWVSVAFSVWLFLFRGGSSVGWGSRKEQLVDKIGDPDSIFEKIRIVLNRLPREFLPEGFRPREHMGYMRIVNPENGSTITGEAGDNIGRGGRKLMYFKDESAHYDRPEKIEAALGDNTNVQVDISSVNGVGTVFHRKRESGEVWTGDNIVKGRTNVFVMDWRDHPAKTQEWYDTRKQKAKEDGLSHIFAQEVDRNYAASVAGTIIKPEWVEAAIDAHIKLDFSPSGSAIAGLDVADDGKAGDKNGLAGRYGPVLMFADDWGGIDPGETTRRVIEELAQDDMEWEINYDCIGLGATVKSEANRLQSEGLMPDNLSFVPWLASATPLRAEEHVGRLPDGNPDRKSPTNKDMFMNLKAQAWWNLQQRFYKTFKAVTEGEQYDPDDLISLPSVLTKLEQIKKELVQPVFRKSTTSLKLVVDKSPNGTKSPNIADAIMQCYWPANQAEVNAMMFTRSNRVGRMLNRRVGTR